MTSILPPLNVSVVPPAASPPWLIAVRQSAAERLAQVAAPDSRWEEWRYSRVDELRLDGAVTARRPQVDDAQIQSWIGELLEGADRDASPWALVVDGYVLESAVPSTLLERGIRVGSASEQDGPTVPVWSEPGVDAFADVNAAGSPDPLVVIVPDRQVLTTPVLVRVETTATGVGLPRVVIDVGADAEASIVVWFDGDAPDATVLARVDVVARAASRVRVATAQTLGARTDLVASVAGRVDRDATLRLSHAALGGRYARTRFDCSLDGRGAEGELSACYVGHDDQMHDLRTFQDHRAPDTRSRLEFRGALDDRAHAVYTGLIRIEEAARGTNAEQSNRIIKLSDDAWAESVPNLEIHNNDVRCAHASSVGPIDEDQRFYLESRGVAPETAERLVVAGFFEQVLAEFTSLALANRLRSMVAARLERRT